MMNQIKLTNTDLMVFPMGLGTASAGLGGYGCEIDRLFDSYLHMGGNLIDTARVYSDWVKPEVGRSERVIGDWLASSKKRHQTVIMTKGGHPDMTVPVPDLHCSRMTKADMVNDLDKSLKALRTDYIDLYFYHRDDQNRTVEELMDVMEDFVKSGKIRYYACSNWSTSRMQEADAYSKARGYRGFAANQALYNIGTRNAKAFSDDTMELVDDDMYEYHKENVDNVLMPYMGICNGFFHKYLKSGEEAVKGSPYYTTENLQIAKQLPTLMDKYGASLSQVVFGFFTQQDVLCVPLYGAKNEEQLKDIMGTYEIRFEKDDYRMNDGEK